MYISVLWKDILWHNLAYYNKHTLDSPIYTSLPMCPLWEVQAADSENGGINISVSYEKKKN